MVNIKTFVLNDYNFRPLFFIGLHSLGGQAAYTIYSIGEITAAVYFTCVYTVVLYIRLIVIISNTYRHCLSSCVQYLAHRCGHALCCRCCGCLSTWYVFLL